MVSKKRKSQKRKSARSSRSQGKANASKRPSNVRRKVRIIDPAIPQERGLLRVKRGETQQAAAKAEGISVKSLRNFMKKNTRAKWVHGKWEIKDSRAVPMLILENGKLHAIPVGSKGATKIGNYWNAVNKFLETNDPKLIPTRKNASVRDALGKVHHLDIDPNALRRGDSIGDLSFHTLYPETVV